MTTDLQTCQARRAVSATRETLSVDLQSHATPEDRFIIRFHRTTNGLQRASETAKTVMTHLQQKRDAYLAGPPWSSDGLSAGRPFPKHLVLPVAACLLPASPSATG